MGDILRKTKVSLWQCTTWAQLGPTEILVSFKFFLFENLVSLETNLRF